MRLSPPAALWTLVALEVLIAALVVCGTARLTRRAPARPWLRAGWRAFRRFAGHRPRAILLVAGVTLLGRAALLPVLGVPEPGFMDEFAHLLAADTFAQGRVTNPSHPMGAHLETMHVNQWPSYQSMFPPAQGAALALGRLVGGHPWVGVWLSTSALAAALCWMLQGWLPPAWALAGGLLFALRTGLFSYWMNSYWGGSVAALGGVLMLGALPRLLRRPTPGVTASMAAGLAMLATSRPFEGALAALPVALVLLTRWARLRGPALRRTAKTAILPLALAMAVLVAGIGHYNWRGTGSPLLMPQQVNWQAYRSASQFLPGAPREPEPAYRHAALRDFYRWEREVMLEARTPRGLPVRLAAKLRTLWLFHVGPALTLALPALSFALRDRRMRLPAAVAGLVTLGVMAQSFGYPHYWAPATGAIALLLAQSLRHLHAWRRRARTGRALVTGLLGAVVLLTVLRPVAGPLQAAHLPLPGWPMASLWSVPGNLARAALLDRLGEGSGHAAFWSRFAQRPAGGPARSMTPIDASDERHLVLVPHRGERDLHDPWVYNRADPDSARVVWAREPSSEALPGLLRHFADRRAWRLEADRTLTPIAPGTAAAMSSTTQAARAPGPDSAARD